MNIQDHEKPAAAPAATAEGLPVWKLLAFTMAGFLAIMTDTSPSLSTIVLGKPAMYH